MKKLFCCPALELFHCLPLWKTVLFVSSRAFLLSTPVENSEATWKKATKCNKMTIWLLQRKWQNSAIQYSNEITLRKEIVAIEGKVGKRMPERIFISMSYFPIYRYLDSKCSHRRLHYTHLYIYIFILSRQSTNSTEQDSPRAEMNNTHFFVINVTCIGDIK